MRHFIVSTRRVLLTSGVIARTVTLLPLRRITDLTWKETLLGQVLGYGTFRFESAGPAAGALGDHVPARAPTSSTGRSAPCCSAATGVAPPPAGTTRATPNRPPPAPQPEADRRDTEPIPGLPPPQ